MSFNIPLLLPTILSRQLFGEKTTFVELLEPAACHMHSLPYDPDEALLTLTRVDMHLATLIERAGPIPRELPQARSPFSALTRSIIYQQLSGKAAATIHGRVEALFFDGGMADPAQMAEISDEALRGAGLSRAKVAAVKDLAAKTLEGIVPPLDVLKKMRDDDIIEHLIQVRGIGPWTVQMFLMFWLGRPDVLPAADLGVRKGFMLTYGLDKLPTPATLVAHGELWRPFRSVASWYMWRAVDLQKAGE